MPHCRRYLAWPQSVSVRTWFCALLLCALAGCAQLPNQPVQPAQLSGPWSGRLHLLIDDPSAPQSFAAHFELQGSALHGTLDLTTPLGTMLARIQWQPGQATLETGSQTQTATSLETLVEQATRTAIPVQAMLAWLNGQQASAPGWHADLESLDQGRLTATRHSPLPGATLRIVLDR
jgi:outer membrane lipoprotein LolB